MRRTEPGCSPASGIPTPGAAEAQAPDRTGDNAAGFCDQVWKFARSRRTECPRKRFVTLLRGDRLSVRRVTWFARSCGPWLLYTRLAVAKSPRPKSPKTPVRVRPTESLPDILERIVPRRQVHVEDGDVVITRERIPHLNPYTTSPAPWQYCVRIYPDPHGTAFTSFQNAASEAEHDASSRHARVIYIEDDAPTVLADYRRRG